MLLGRITSPTRAARRAEMQVRLQDVLNSIDLENFVSDRPIVAHRSSPPERAWRWCRRNKAAAGLLAASAVAGFALVGAAVGFFFNLQLTAVAEREQRLGYIHIVLAEREWPGNNMPRAEQRRSIVLALVG
jgi:hypothetical protein